MREQKISIPLENGFGKVLVKANGKLNSIILNCEDRTEILLTSELGYTIFNIKDFIGVSYIPVRVQARDNEAHRISYSKCKYSLNEKILIQVQSISRRFFKDEKSVIKLIIRYDE